MSKDKKNTEVAVKDSDLTAVNFENLSFEDKKGFEQSTVDFFDTEGMEGIEMRIVFTKISDIEITGQKRKFAVGYLAVNGGWRQLHFGQKQIVLAIERTFVEGKKVQAYITYKGKTIIEKSNRPMNDFLILTKVVD